MATNSPDMEKSHDTPGFKHPELPQTQSVLFTKLPPELRERVYFFVFEEFPRIKVDEKPWDWRGSDEGKLQAVDESITLLKVCQRIHFEALAVFYRSAIFKIIHPSRMVTLFPPAAHSSIHTFWIDVLLNADDECEVCSHAVDYYLDEITWGETVRVLNEQMPSLRHLHISIILRKISVPVEHFRALLEENVYPALMRMKKLHCFRVLVNFENVAPANAPFKVISAEYLGANKTKDGRELASNEAEEEVSMDDAEEESTKDVEDEYISEHDEKAWDIRDGWKIAFH